MVAVRGPTGHDAHVGSKPGWLVVAALALTVAGCRGGHASTAVSPSSAAVATTTTLRPGASPIIGPATSAQQAARDCSPTDLALDYYGGGGAIGNDFGMIRIRDTAGAPCLLRGPIVVTGANVAGHVVTRAVSYPVVSDLVLSAHAARVPVGEVAPQGEHVATSRYPRTIATIPQVRMASVGLIASFRASGKSRWLAGRSTFATPATTLATRPTSSPRW
jgi:hypothetical protein